MFPCFNIKFCKRALPCLSSLRNLPPTNFYHFVSTDATISNRHTQLLICFTCRKSALCQSTFQVLFSTISVWILALPILSRTFSRPASVEIIQRYITNPLKMVLIKSAENQQSLSTKVVIPIAPWHEGSLQPRSLPVLLSQAYVEYSRSNTFPTILNVI